MRRVADRLVRRTILPNVKGFESILDVGCMTAHALRRAGFDGVIHGVSRESRVLWDAKETGLYDKVFTHIPLDYDLLTFVGTPIIPQFVRVADTVALAYQNKDNFHKEFYVLDDLVRTGNIRLLHCNHHQAEKEFHVLFKSLNLD